MLISQKSLKNFIFINGILLYLGICQQILVSYFENQFLSVFWIFVCRNYLLLHLVDIGTWNKPRIHEENMPTEIYKGEFHVNVLSATCVEALTYIFVESSSLSSSSSSLSSSSSSSYGMIYDIFFFIPVSFAFEICFDFFHYIGHRMLHHTYVYKFMHKKHHKFQHPISITTFYQHPMDLLITNTMPTILSLYLLGFGSSSSSSSYISYNQFHCMILYKNFVEISGHCGRDLYPVCSFT